MSIRTRKYYVRDAMSGWSREFLYMNPLLQSMKLFTGLSELVPLDSRTSSLARMYPAETSRG